MDIQRVLSKTLTKKFVKNLIVGISFVFLSAAFCEIILCIMNFFLFFWIEAVFNILFFVVTLTIAYFGFKTGKSRDVPEQDRKFSMMYSVFLIVIIIALFVYVVVCLISGSLVSYFESFHGYLPSFIADSISKGWFVLLGVMSHIILYLILIVFCVGCFFLSYLNIRHISHDIDGGYNIVKTTDEDEELDDAIFEDSDEGLQEDSLKIHNEEMKFVDSSEEEEEKNGEEDEKKKEEAEVKNK